MIALTTVIFVILLLYVLGLCLIAWFCLHPMRIPLFLSASALGLPQEKVTFVTEDEVELRGWWITPETPKMVCVLSHGYIMNRAECIPLAKKLYEAGVACLVYDFRAHGYSGGKMSTIGYAEKRDVKAAVGVARTKYPDLSLLGYGSSMGGAASALAAADAMKEDIKLFDAMMMDSTYRQLHHTNKGWWDTFLPAKYEFLLRPVWLFCWMITRIDPRTVLIDEALGLLKDVPVLIMHGQNDLIVPIDQAKLNFQANTNIRFEVFENCQHSQARYLQTEKYDKIMFEFIEDSIGISLS